MSPALVAPDTGPPESTPSPTLVVLAAGLSTRYGAVKPLASVGPQGEALIDYALYDAARSGYGDAILVVRREIEAEVSRHVEELTAGSWPCRLVCQRTDDLPGGVALAGRPYEALGDRPRCVDRATCRPGAVRRGERR